jgi:hypothetical protein
MDKILEVKSGKNHDYYVRAKSSVLKDTDDEVSIRIMNYGNDIAYFGSVYKQVEKPDGSGTEKRVVINDMVNRSQILRYVASALNLSKEEFRASAEDYLAYGEPKD